MHPLIWPDCRNVRDLGGLPAAGGELQLGRLVRSDNLDQLSRVGRAAVEAAGISRFVDLRSTWESEASASTILCLLNHVDERYGGTRAYLLNAGVTTGQLNALTGRLAG